MTTTSPSTLHRSRRPVGATGLTVSPIGLGGAYLGLITRSDGAREIDEEVGIATVLRALDLGVNLIDTSAGYMNSSQSERIVGAAIARWLESGGRREEIVLETKTGTRRRGDRTAADYGARATWESIETSLRLLRVDYLDIALVHDPMDLAPVLAPDGAWAALQEMKHQGLVRAIGLGTRSHADHRRMIATGTCDVCLTHSDFNLLTQTARAGVIAPASRAGVAVFNATSLAHGLLLGDRSPTEIVAGWGDSWHAHLKAEPQWPTMFKRAQALWDWTQSQELDLLALNLQYITREPGITATLMGAATPAQIEADVAALTAELPEDIWAALADLINQG
jgi:D-threo-aldose 1-dehydrogenase